MEQGKRLFRWGMSRVAGVLHDYYEKEILRLNKSMIGSVVFVSDGSIITIFVVTKCHFERNGEGSICNIEAETGLFQRGNIRKDLINGQNCSKGVGFA